MGMCHRSGGRGDRHREGWVKPSTPPGTWHSHPSDDVSCTTPHKLPPFFKLQLLPANLTGDSNPSYQIPL